MLYFSVLFLALKGQLYAIQHLCVAPLMIAALNALYIFKIIVFEFTVSENSCGKREIVQGECHVSSTVRHGLAGERRSSPTERFVVGRRNCDWNLTIKLGLRMAGTTSVFGE